MSEMLPSNKPQLKKEDAEKLLTSFDVAQYPVKLLGIRGYFKKTIGNPNSNDIGVYDDALFIISADNFSSFNFNTDPSRSFPGVAVLKPGMYLYKIGLHGMHHLNMSAEKDQKIYDQLIHTKKDIDGILTYWALRQFSRVVVIRNGKDCPDSAANPAWIDIHRGGYGTTSSLGCQTVHPDQWHLCFWETIKPLMEKNNQDVIPYCLIEY